MRFLTPPLLPVMYKNVIMEEDSSNLGGSIFSLVITGISVCLLVVTFPFSMVVAIKQVPEYQRAVIFRLGRNRRDHAVGPGIFFVLPCVDSVHTVDLRTVTFNVPPQEILSRDSVTVRVDAIVYYRITDPLASIINVSDASMSTQLLASTALRNILGTKSLSEILSDREATAGVMLGQLEEATKSWGIKVERVEVKDVSLPQELQRAMAAEAEASREAQARIIAADGEKDASQTLKRASDVISSSPAALQLRYLQAVTTISAETDSTLVFPVPMDIVTPYLNY